MRNASRQRRAGYSFLDVVITVMILGILSSAAAPRFFEAIRRLRVESAARRVAHDLRYARRQAKITGGQETVSFDVAGHRYALSTAPDLRRPSQVYSVRLTDSPYESTLASVDFGGAATVTFNAYGAPDVEGQVVVQSGTHQRIVAVEAGSGNVSIEQP